MMKTTRTDSGYADVAYHGIRVAAWGGGFSFDACLSHFDCVSWGRNERFTAQTPCDGKSVSAAAVDRKAVADAEQRLG